MISSRTHMERLAANVSLLMEMNGETIRALAVAVESAPTSIFQLIKAQNDPRMSLVARLAEHYQVSIDDLLSPASVFVEIIENAAR